MFTEKTHLVAMKVLIDHVEYRESQFLCTKLFGPLNRIVLEFTTIPLGQNGSRQNYMVWKRNLFSRCFHNVIWYIRWKPTQTFIPRTTYYIEYYSYIRHTSLRLEQGKEEMHRKQLLRISADHLISKQMLNAYIYYSSAFFSM